MSLAESNKTKNRRRLEIVRDVLTIASEGARKTKIMYRANLSFVQLERYLKTLLDGGLVELNNGSSYLTTQKGEEFLKTYAGYLEHCSQLKERVEEAATERRLLERMCFDGKRNGVEADDETGALS